MQPFDSAAVVKLGAFIDAAYAMYDKPQSADPLKPANDDRIPEKFELVAWITISDFVGQDKEPRFYGYLAQDPNDQERVVIAMRGTEGIVEWWDDFHAILTPFPAIPNEGRVSSGFLAIYRTLEIVSVDPVQRELGGGAYQSFSDKVAALAAAYVSEIGGGNRPFDPSQSMVPVTGHSLGAALRTLYVMENAIRNVVRNPLLCTFASPLVGDTGFVDCFNGIGLTSWRIANAPDIVPKLPPPLFGYRHVNQLVPVDFTGKAKATLSCAHAMNTYLAMLGTGELDAACAAEAEDQEVGGGPAFYHSASLELGGGSFPTARRAELQDLVEPLGHAALTPLVQASNEIGYRYGIDPCFLAAFAEHESHFNKESVSFNGNYGRGLMQIDAGFHSFTEVGVVYEKPHRWVTGGGRTGKAADVMGSIANGAAVFDTYECIAYACHALLLPAFAHFAGRSNTEICVIASYNAGVGRVDATLARWEPAKSATYDPQFRLENHCQQHVARDDLAGERHAILLILALFDDRMKGLP